MTVLGIEVAVEHRAIKHTHLSMFHPDSDYSIFVGVYMPSMELFPRTFMKGEEIARVAKGDSNLLEEKRIVYRFVEQAFLEAYVAAWAKRSRPPSENSWRTLASRRYRLLQMAQKSPNEGTAP